MISAILATRREFLAISATAVLAGASPPQDPAPAPADWKLGAQTYTFRNFATERALKEINGLGLRYAEFYEKHIPPRADGKQRQAFLALCKEYQVAPIAFGVSTFTKDHDQNRRLFDFGKELGLAFLTASPTPDSFDSLDKLCAEYGIGIAIHPHGPIGGGRLDRWYCAEAILEAVKDRHPLIGSCLDTGHLIRAAQLGKKLDVPEQVRIMGGRNFGLHLKDHDNQRKTDVILGKGALDVPALVTALGEVKFCGFISIEYEANADHPTPDVRECLEVWRRATA
jgi:inosose dehydratase